MNTVLSATARHGAPLPPGQDTVVGTWPGDEAEVDWGLNLGSDLGPEWRWALLALVVLAHALLAALVLRARVKPLQPMAPLVISAQLVNERAQPVPASSRSEDAPVSKQEVPKRSRRSLVEPAWHEPRQAPAPTAPAPVLASPNAQAVPTQAMPAPAPTQPAEPRANPSAQTPIPPAPPASPSPAHASAANMPMPGAEAPRPATAPKELPMSAMRYLTEPSKVYPRTSREMGETGVVLLRVLIDEEGRPRTVQLVKSSGFPRLDRQAVQNMGSARFQPHLDGGVPRAVWAPAEIIFNLD